MDLPSKCHCHIFSAESARASLPEADERPGGEKSPARPQQNIHDTLASGCFQLFCLKPEENSPFEPEGVIFTSRLMVEEHAAGFKAAHHTQI